MTLPPSKTQEGDDSPFGTPPLEEAEWGWSPLESRRLRRIWHFFAGHPTEAIFLYCGSSEKGCEGCGKAGRRL